MVSALPSTRFNSVLSNFTSVTSTGRGLPACLTAKVELAVPLLMVTDAARSSYVSFGWAVTVIVTSPAPPELGATVNQLAALVASTFVPSALVSATVAVQAAGAVKFTVCV